jgi:predicted RNA binding protein YcfA (HicA-like mRNA interferase family)
MRAGWYVLREGRGSHKILAHPDKPGEIIVFPDHGNDEMGKGLESKILKQAGLK